MQERERILRFIGAIYDDGYIRIDVGSGHDVIKLNRKEDE